ncbi:MAG: NADH-quinone oxidoreductase subunit C [Opitutus sp.]
MTPKLEQLTTQFTELIGPEAFARAAAAAAQPNPGPTVPAAAPSTALSATPSAAPVTAPAAAKPSPAPAAPPPPLQVTSHALKGWDLDARVSPLQVVAAAELLDRAGFAIDAVTGVDWLAQDQMEVVYDFFHPIESLRVVVRTRVPRANSEVPTISAVFPGANWHERETHDFFGIRFTGHPNLAPFLLPEDATFHPLRKDYTP